MDDLRELVQFMQPSQRLDLKSVATANVLCLTGSDEGKAAIVECEDIIAALIRLTCDENLSVAKDAVLSLINLTAEEFGAVKVLETSKNVQDRPLIQIAVKHITDENSEFADAWAMVLCNMSRVERLVNDMLDEMEKDENIFFKLGKSFSKLNYNKKNSKLHYLGPLFCNLTQSSRGRELFCNSRYDLFDKVLPFICYPESVVRRGGIIGVVKNICFDPVYHTLILTDKDDVLHSILNPLCGPEEFTEEENEQLPIELQYLPEDKAREVDPDLRKMLLESLLQLCATKRYRELLRSKGVYFILREYHKWEAKVGKDSECLLACENVVDILIKKEEEIGLDNYKEVAVPNDVAEKFVKDDSEYLKNLI
ncbi:protein HGH1 homolog [Teleopsis dalmanni]|uniref:protein HGH1 homolog n=1 Tax=Teleopsis dalmanni TaxID=139649 RepID=UPI0018CF07B5|nr:protein HGH1 homolog [Teleopsis dalmanni]